MARRKAILALVVCLVVLLGAFDAHCDPVTKATATRSGSSPLLPYRDWGACPFECCEYREWTVTAATRVLNAPAKGAGPAFELAPRDTVSALTGVVITRRCGAARARRSTTVAGAAVALGESVYVMHDEGEGFWKVWWRGRAENAEVVDPENTQDLPEPDLVMIRFPVTDWWVKVKNRKGQTGWALVHDNFGNMDACE